MDVASCQTASCPAVGVPKMPAPLPTPDTAQSVLFEPGLSVQSMPVPVKRSPGRGVRGVVSLMMVWPPLPVVRLTQAQLFVVVEYFATWPVVSSHCTRAFCCQIVPFPTSILSSAGVVPWRVVAVLALPVTLPVRGPLKVPVVVPGKVGLVGILRVMAPVDADATIWLGVPVMVVGNAVQPSAPPAASTPWGNWPALQLPPF